MIGNGNNSRRRKVYEVQADRKVGGWKIVSEGTCLKRTTTKKEAITAARERARNRATDPDFGSNAELRVRNMNGSVYEVARYEFRVDAVRDLTATPSYLD